MKIEYEVTLCFKVTHEVDTLEGLKSDRKYAEEIAHLVCNEVATVGGVATYSMQDSCLYVTEILPVNVNENKADSVTEKFLQNF